eukprot:TRINITY_DN17634_c0_g1::TRINITY_DN17634_c0_g1_i1::g.11427::m.11427 TRINITY_DN17634_c0_g1::TRINITY_DN17634_c0_g1_i1::g.11427  ORF type:complete len:112 (+),score=-28.76,DUF2244/PF10003.4/0.25,Ctr/PF04145.10/0.24,Peptidase_S49_N/PF08496.5/0.22,BLVR/PF06375.6/0.44,Serinc/PF03348.10/0.5 TRINITY_DN17634_c0_g1_i1:110-445(+)
MSAKIMTEGRNENHTCEALASDSDSSGNMILLLYILFLSGLQSERVRVTNSRRHVIRQQAITKEQNINIQVKTEKKRKKKRHREKKKKKKKQSHPKSRRSKEKLRNCSGRR